MLSSPLSLPQWLLCGLYVNGEKGLGSVCDDVLTQPQGLSPYALEAFENMKQIVLSWSNFKKFKEKLSLSSLPCVPYLSTYIAQLHWVEMNIPDNVVRDLLSWAEVGRTHAHPPSRAIRSG